MGCLLLGVPGNVRDFDPYRIAPIGAGYRAGFVALVASPLLDELPAADRPNPAAMKDVTVGWLRAGRDDGRLPTDGSGPVEKARATVMLSLQQARVRAPDTGCAVVPKAGRTLQLAANQSFGFRGGDIRVKLAGSGDLGSANYDFLQGQTITAQVPITVVVLRAPGFDDVRVCG
jgi:hypothetical protein